MHTADILPVGMKRMSAFQLSAGTRHPVDIIFYGMDLLQTIFHPIFLSLCAPSTDLSRMHEWKPFLSPS